MQGRSALQCGTLRRTITAATHSRGCGSRRVFSCSINFCAPSCPQLRGALKEWLNWLKEEVGFTAWRLDYAKASNRLVHCVQCWACGRVGAWAAAQPSTAHVHNGAILQGYAAQYTQEYVEATTGAGALNVGEYWVDMAWEGSDLEANQVRL